VIDNTGNTGTREMLMTSIISATGEPDFDALEKAEFAPALILPKSDMIRWTDAPSICCAAAA
jgi:hypothetical protein